MTAAIKRIFKWGASQELVPVKVYQALSTVAGLQKGRTDAVESPPIAPVADELVDASLPYLPEIIADMVRLQRLTGCRPGEVCILRPVDVDTTGDVWIYRPASHKTQYRGRERMIYIGPKGQDVLCPYLDRDAAEYCFSPIDSERRLEALHAKRKTPISYGNRPGTNRKRKPKKQPREFYSSNTYRQAIHRAIDKANKDRSKQSAEMGVAFSSVSRHG